jgi:DoxX-like family
MRFHRTLWTVQALLAALFLFAGIFKLVMPVEAMQGPLALPGAFLRFIGVAETLGALGLLLPMALKRLPALTPLAACGLTIIMIGAVGVSRPLGAGAAALPAIVGVFAATVAWGRRALLHGQRAPGLAEQPTLSA